MHTDFVGLEKITIADSPARPKGWRGAPAILESTEDNRFGVKLVNATQDALSKNKPYIEIGFKTGTEDSALSIDPKSVAYLAQEIRSPLCRFISP